MVYFQIDSWHTTSQNLRRAGVWQTFDASVKIVVAHGSCIVAHFTHEFHFELSPIQVKVGRALKYIA